MTFLRLLHETGYQNFTYTCINSVAWLEQSTNNHDQALKLLGANEQEFAFQSERLSIIFDGCKVSFL